MSPPVKRMELALALPAWTVRVNAASTYPAAAWRRSSRSTAASSELKPLGLGRVGDAVMWDERATMHRGAGDYEPSERRVMLRTIVYPTDGVTTAM